MLTLKEVLEIDDLPRREVQVKNWNGTVLIRSLRADERAELEKIFTEKKPGDDPNAFRSELLLRTLINDDGTPWMTREDLGRLMAKSAHAVETIFEATAELNAFRKEDVEELEKN